ncbi:cyclic nucleotide-binding domain protein [Leptospira interrogans str. L0996]|nr:cyclic nucleotide-binding domain protein [Leptospira interrogans str. L0996]
MEIKNEIPDCYLCPNRHKFVYFRKNELLIQEGTKTNGFYFIKSGCVRIFRNSSSGKEQTFSIRRAGEWVGFRDQNRSHRT